MSSAMSSDEIKSATAHEVNNNKVFRNIIAFPEENIGKFL